MIRTQTSRKTDIPNWQGTEISTLERNNTADLLRSFGNKLKPRTQESPIYNCHGLTFGSRRTRILETQTVKLIVRDDRYEEINNQHDVQPGDVVLYSDDEGEINHSGVVIENSGHPLFVVRICSKWGSGPELIHLSTDIPSMYGPFKKFYRCRL